MCMTQHRVVVVFILEHPWSGERFVFFVSRCDTCLVELISYLMFVSDADRQEARKVMPFLLLLICKTGERKAFQRALWSYCNLRF